MNLLENVKVSDFGLPEEFELRENYPNPFNPVTTIRYALAQSEAVTIEIYNILGQKVKTLINNVQTSSGRYRVQWDSTNDFGSRVASGVYIYRIRAGKNIAMKKMVLIK